MPPTAELRARAATGIVEASLAPATEARTVAVIDVGTNSVRLVIARVSPGGIVERIAEEREPIRPGEGVFLDRTIRPAAAQRLVEVLRRFSDRCRAHGAELRAVATSAFRHAANSQPVIRRIRRETGLDLEVISGRAEARLVCLGALHDRPRALRSLVVDVGGGSTEVALAHGREPLALWSVPVGALRLTEAAAAAGHRNEERAVSFMERRAAEALAAARLELVPRSIRMALGASGTVRAVVAFASGGAPRASRLALDAAVETLVRLGPTARARHFDRRRADIIIAGAIIVAALARRIGVDWFESAPGGLREGVLLDMAPGGFDGAEGAAVTPEAG